MSSLILVVAVSFLFNWH